jgi:type I restriction enzyme S subunit
MLRITDIQNNKVDWLKVPFCDIAAPDREKYLLQKWDLVFARTGATVGKSFLIRDDVRDSVFASYLIRVRTFQSDVARYLSRFFDSPIYWNQITEFSAGIGQPNVNGSKLKNLRIPLAPLNEQKRIADKLDAVLARVDACRERLDRVPAILKRFRQSVLAAATSGKLTEEWREENKQIRPSEIQVSEIEVAKSGQLRVRGRDATLEKLELYELPDGWAWIKNHRLATDSPSSICAGPFGTIFKAKDFRSFGVPIIFLRHVGAGRYITNKPGFMDETVWHEFHQPYSVFGGELLVAKLGDPPGTACIYPKNIGIAMVTPDVMKMQVDERTAVPEYLMYFFNSTSCKKLIEELAFGVTRLRIDLS